MKKKLLNPRGYISPTQVDMWLRSRERYIRNYFEGEQDQGNVYTEYGSRVAKAQEDGGDSEGDVLIDTFIAMLPEKYPHREYTMRVPFETKHGTVELLGRMDQWHDELLAFRDTKTGTKPWTIAKAQKSVQMRHYSSMIYLKHGKLPSEAWIDWGETSFDSEGNLALTGRVEALQVKHSLADVLEYLALVTRVAVEIDAAYRDYLKKMA